MVVPEGTLVSQRASQSPDRHAKFFLHLTVCFRISSLTLYFFSDISSPERPESLEIFLLAKLFPSKVWLLGRRLPYLNVNGNANARNRNGVKGVSRCWKHCILTWGFDGRGKEKAGGGLDAVTFVQFVSDWTRAKRFRNRGGLSGVETYAVRTL
jgi:hypothetical protein